MQQKRNQPTVYSLSIPAQQNIAFPTNPYQISKIRTNDHTYQPDPYIQAYPQIGNTNKYQKWNIITTNSGNRNIYQRDMLSGDDDQLKNNINRQQKYHRTQVEQMSQLSMNNHYRNNSRVQQNKQVRNQAKYNCYSCLDQPYERVKTSGCTSFICPDNQCIASDSKYSWFK